MLAVWPLQAKKHGVFDNLAITEVFDDNALEELGRHVAVPDAIRIDHHDRTAGAHTKARRLTTLHATRSEQQSFALQQCRKSRIQLPPTTIRRAEATDADENVTGI